MQVHSINNLATAQSKKGTPSLTDVTSLGRPQKFSGKEKNFEQWLKKTEAFFTGTIKESEMMLAWSAEQTKEITTTTTDLEFLQTLTIEERRVRNLEFVLQQTYSTHDSHELSRK